MLILLFGHPPLSSWTTGDSLSLFFSLCDPILLTFSFLSFCLLVSHAFSSIFHHFSSSSSTITQPAIRTLQKKICNRKIRLFTFFRRFFLPFLIVIRMAIAFITFLMGWVNVAAKILPQFASFSKLCDDFVRNTRHELDQVFPSTYKKRNLQKIGEILKNQNKKNPFQPAEKKHGTFFWKITL